VLHSAIAAMAATVEPTKTAPLPGRFASLAFDDFLITRPIL
jgi:hypothetical protein